MKTFFKIAAGALLVIALLCACGSTNNTAKPENVKELPRYEELSALIGLSAEEVEQKVQWELTETELAYDYIYQTPIEVEFCDVDLRIDLADNPKVGKINSVLYRADYTNDNAFNNERPSYKPVSSSHIFHNMYFLLTCIDIKFDCVCNYEYCNYCQ